MTYVTVYLCILLCFGVNLCQCEGKSNLHKAVDLKKRRKKPKWKED